MIYQTMQFSTEVTYTQNFNTPNWLIDITVSDKNREIVMVSFTATQKEGSMFWQEGVSLEEQIFYIKEHEAAIRNIAREHAREKVGIRWETL